MNLANINWKNTAKVVGFILIASIIGNAISYYEHRHQSLGALIPEEVFIQIAKPYLAATIASIVTTAIAWIFYYFSKYKATVVVGVLTFAFQIINFNIIGERWDF